MNTRKGITILMCFFTVALSASTIANDQSITNRLDTLAMQVIEQYNAGNYEDVLTLSKEIYKDGMAWEELPSLLDDYTDEEIELYRYDFTKDDYTDAEMIWLNILWYKAYSLYALKRYEESIEPFDFVIQNHPELNSAVLDIYTWILWDLGLREKVYSVLDTAIKKMKEQDRSTMFYLYTYYLYKDGKYKRALDTSSEGYQNFPGNENNVLFGLLSQVELENKKAVMQWAIRYWNIALHRKSLPEQLKQFDETVARIADNRLVILARSISSILQGDITIEQFADAVEKKSIGSDILDLVYNPHGDLITLFVDYFFNTGNRRAAGKFSQYAYIAGDPRFELDYNKNIYYRTDKGTRYAPWDPDRFIQETPYHISRLYKPDGDSEPSLVLRKGHAHITFTANFSPDGLLMVSGSKDNTVKVWRLDGYLLRTLRGHTDSIVNAVFSRDGRQIISASKDNTIRWWDLEGNLLKTVTIGGKKGISAAAFSPDGKKIAISQIYYNRDTTGDNMDYNSYNNIMIHLYSAQGDLIKKFVMPDMETINSMTFSPDSRRLVTGHGHYLLGSGDNVIRVWNLEGTVLQEFKGHIDAVLAVAVSPDGTILASGSESGDLILWNMDGTVIRRLNATETDKDAINSIAFSPDSSLVSTAAGAFPYRKNGDDTVKLWSKEGHLLKVMRGHSDSVMFTGFYNNGRMVATTSKDGTIRLWDLRGNPVHTFEAAWDFIYCSTFHPGGKLFATGDNLNRIHVRKTNGSIIATYSHSRYISDLQYSPDGSLLAAATGESNIVVRDKSGTVVTVIDSDRTIQQFCFTEDGGKIVSLDYNNIIRVWSTDGRLLNSFPKFEAMVDTFFLVPGKEQLAVGYKQDIVFYSLDGKEVRRFNYYQDFVESQMFSIYRVSNIAISPDNRYIAATANDMMGNGKYIIKVFSPEGGLVRTLEGHSATLTAFAFSPDSRLLVSGSVDGEVRIWDVASGDFTKLTGHTDEIRDLDFNNNGTLLLSVSKDTSSRLWNVQNGRNISIVNQEDEWIAYSPDGLFDSSREGGNIVSIVDGLFVYGLDQFAVTMNRPDIILGETGLADRQETDYYHALHEKRLRKLGLDTNGNSMKYEVPIALIKSIQQNGKFLKVRFLVSGKTMPVNRYNIYINDVPIYGAYGKPVKDKKRATIVETIELSRGSNKIEISCTATSGAESIRALANADYILPADSTPAGDLYFIGFGVSTYQDETLNLGYAHKDVLDLKNMFERMDGFNKVHTRMYINEQCLVSNIKNVKEFLQDAAVDDTLVLFIAGHGMHDTDRTAKYYYLTHETDINDLAGTAAPFELVENILQGIAPRNKLFLMDTCESGEVDEETKKSYRFATDANLTARGIAINVKPQTTKKIIIKRAGVRDYLRDRERYIYNDLLRRSGAIVFSSSKGGEFSYENAQYENGFFTEAIINGLEGKADSDGNGSVSTGELRRYVIRTVTGMSNNLQNPTVDRDNIYQQFGFPVVTNAR